MFTNLNSMNVTRMEQCTNEYGGSIGDLTILFVKVFDIYKSMPANVIDSTDGAGMISPVG